MLRWRIVLGCLLVLCLVGLCWLDMRLPRPAMALWPLWAVVALLAVGETRRLARAQADPLAWPSYLGVGLILLLEAAAIYFPEHPLSTTNWLPLAIGLTFVAACIAEMRRYEKPGRVTINLAMSLLPVLYIGLLGHFLILLRQWRGDTWGMAALVSCIAAVKAGDTGAYTTGRLFGRHKMAPILSPGKTWEGAAGGFALSIAVAWFVLRVATPNSSGIASDLMPPLGVVGYAMLVCGFGMLGDLTESMLKRDAGQKDSSPWMPGFGGVLDILDSILVAAPVAFLCWECGLVGSG